MKKVILSSLTVMSLALFSFTMPGDTNIGVVQGVDGNYEVAREAGAKMQDLDRQNICSLIQKIYNIENPDAEQPLKMLAAAGSYKYIEYVPYFWVMYHAIYRGTDYSVAIEKGSDGERLVSLFEKYAVQK